MNKWLPLLLLLLATSARAQLGGDFSLTDHHGQPFDSRQLRGQVALLFFGYTSCPDVCPTELMRLRVVLDELGEQGERVQPLFVSVDPQRDTPEHLARYVTWFHPRILGLSGSDAELRSMTARFKAGFKRNAESLDSYTVDHSANLFVLDPEGELAAIVPYGLPPEHIVQVVRGLLD